MKITRRPDITRTFRTSRHNRCGCRWSCWRFWRRSADSSESAPAFTGGKHVGGRLNIVNWLNPIIWNPATRSSTLEAEATRQAPLQAEAGHAVAADHGETEPAADAHADVCACRIQSGPRSRRSSCTVTLLTEWVFIIISLVVAGIGIVLGVSVLRQEPAPAGHLGAATQSALRRQLQQVLG